MARPDQPGSARDVQCQCMNTPDQLRAKGRVNGAVAFQPAHGRELRRPDDHAEMTFATLGIAGMAAMLFTFVNDLKALW